VRQNELQAGLSPWGKVKSCETYHSDGTAGDRHRSSRSAALLQSAASRCRREVALLVRGTGHGREQVSARLWRLLRSLLPHYASQTVFERADQIIKNRSLAGGENHVRGHSS
jgi:hypothetical protein